MKFKNGSIGKMRRHRGLSPAVLFPHAPCWQQGSLLDNKFHSQKLKTNKSKRTLHEDAGFPATSDHPYTTQFEAFFTALAAGKDMPLTSFANAARTHEIMFAADKSAATGSQGFS